MSLSKQLLILISVLFLMIFSLNFILSVNNIRSYLEGEAEVHAQDTATSLGLSLSPYMVDENDPIIETTMKAIFDRGYYQQIKLVNIDEKTLVDLSNENKIEGVPDWFVKFIPMKGAIAESEISSGWNISGVVHVAINPGYAYLKLFEQVEKSFYYSLATFVFSIFLLHMLLRMMLASLRRIDQMALTIADGEFVTIETLPWTTEIKNVALSMNMMSRKIENVIKNLNLRLTGVGKKLQQDDLTGLYKKSVFETDLKHLFTTEVEAYVFLIKIDGLSGLVKEFDNDSIDQFLKDFSQVLADVSKDNEKGDILVYRFFGSEFALLIKDEKVEKVEVLAKKLSASFAEVGAKYKKPDIAHIGVIPFNPVDTIDGMLLAANEAYEQAQIIGQNSYYLRIKDDQAKDMAEWKSLVFSVVDNQGYEITYLDPVEKFETGETIMEEAFLKVVDKNNQNISIGTFVSIAEKYSKIVELDQGGALKVVEYIKANQVQHAIAINLSTRTIKNSSFRSWLSDLINKNKGLSSQLVFSLSAYAVAKEINVYKEFIDFIHQLNAKVMIKRYEARSLSPENTKYLKPDFIRLARELGQDVSTEQEKKTFIETMQEMGELIDISILAENIKTEEDYKCLQQTGILGASR